MSQPRVFEIQIPLRKRYKAEPEVALVIDRARALGNDPDDPFHSNVMPMPQCGIAVPVGVHRAIGGLHDAPTPGDILCAALAACQDSSVRMVAVPRRGLEPAHKQLIRNVVLMGGAHLPTKYPLWRWPLRGIFNHSAVEQIPCLRWLKVDVCTKYI